MWTLILAVSDDDEADPAVFVREVGGDGIESCRLDRLVKKDSQDAGAQGYAFPFGQQVVAGQGVHVRSTRPTPRSRPPSSRTTAPDGRAAKIVS